MSFWTQYSEDSVRLPAGMQRIGYDADSAQYSFRDSEGHIYLGPPHQEYGLLIRVKSSGHDRPGMFASEKSKPATKIAIRDQPQGSGSTFHDILPAHLITTAPSPTEEVSGWARFFDVGRATTPSDPAVVQEPTPRGNHFVLLDEKAIFRIS
ncbi:hypothetical protein C8R43DRAFT_1142753 [Mycena crocata]|nr:hypothetical protein C8R43DRAFT_1142753 [Mycena crocata]